MSSIGGDTLSEPCLFLVCSCLHSVNIANSNSRLVSRISIRCGIILEYKLSKSNIDSVFVIEELAIVGHES